jgi:hypothetical protein
MKDIFELQTLLEKDFLGVQKTMFAFGEIQETK